jgi:hypothetical protein
MAMNNSPNAVAPQDLPSFIDVNAPSLLNPAMASSWCVSNSGNEALDTALGIFLAKQAIAYANKTNSNDVILFALAEMGLKGRFGWIEAAFVNRLANAARAGVMN